MSLSAAISGSTLAAAVLAFFVLVFSFSTSFSSSLLCLFLCELTVGFSRLSPPSAVFA
jgi:hypothetical protein